MGAEPVNEAVQVFAQRHMTPYYINSYWATEHGGIVWSRVFGDERLPLPPDTRSWPLPWIVGSAVVGLADGAPRPAADGEQGDVLIEKQYPYLALTVWQSDGFGTKGWQGDMKRWAGYFQGGAYVQGDAVVRHAPSRALVWPRRTSRTPT